MVKTRQRDYDSPSNHEESSSNNINTPAGSSSHGTLLERRRRWVQHLHDFDYRTVITEVLELELPKYSASTVVIPTSLSSIMRECVLILSSAPLIFTAAVAGTLAEHYSTNTDLQAEYAEIQARAHIQPSIYIHLLADQNGVAPTPNQYMTIREIVLKYIDLINIDNDLGHIIDNISQPIFPNSSSTTGQRKYLRTARSICSSARLATTHRFCDGVLARYNATANHLRDIPFPYPPTECGYSINSHTRLLQHQRRISSNYIMNLVEDICTYLHRTTHPLFSTQNFHMHQFIIYLIFRPAQAQIAEIFCSSLLQVWIDDGGGFNGYPAGRSNRSVRGVSNGRWEEFEQYAIQRSELTGKVRVQRKMVEDMVTKLNECAARLWREVLASLEDFS